MFLHSEVDKLPIAESCVYWQPLLIVWATPGVGRGVLHEGRHPVLALRPESWTTGPRYGRGFWVVRL